MNVVCLNKMLAIVLVQLKGQKTAVTGENIVNYADVQVTAKCQEVRIVLNIVRFLWN